MGKQSVTLKQTKKTTLNVIGQLLLTADGVNIETDDFGVVNLSDLTSDFNGKEVKIAITEQLDEELEVM